MNQISLLSSSKSEWIKFRSVRSTLYGIIALISLTVVLGGLIVLLVASNYKTFPTQRRLAFDPFSVSMVGLFFAQFVVGVVGAMFITNEYSTSSIRTSLAAVPRRTMFILSKLVVMAATMIVVCEAIVFLAFIIGQAELANGPAPSLSLGYPGALRAVILAGVYLVLLAGLGFALGLLLRKTPAAIVVFVVTMLIVPILTDILPSNWSGPIQRFLPSDLGTGMMSINQAKGVYPPFGCALILVGYVVALVAIGVYVFNHRDA